MTVQSREDSVVAFSQRPAAPGSSPEPGVLPAARPAADPAHAAYLDQRTQAMAEQLRMLRSVPDWIEDALAETGQTLPEEVYALLSLVGRTATRLDQMGRDTARYEAIAGAEAQAAPIHLRAFLEKLCAAYEVSEVWTFRYTVPDLAFFTDAALLAEALRPLVENACIHGSPPGGAIALEARVEGERLVIAVIDEGEGLPDAVRAPAPFTSVASPDEGGGSGLGLSIAAAAAARLGGALHLADAPAGGTRAEIHLPAGGTPPTAA